MCRMLKGEIACPPVATHRVIQVLRQEEQRIHWFMTCIFFIKWRFIPHFQGPTFRISSTWPQPRLHEQIRETIWKSGQRYISCYIALLLSLFTCTIFIYIHFWVFIIVNTKKVHVFSFIHFSNEKRKIHIFALAYF